MPFRLESKSSGYRLKEAYQNDKVYTAICEGRLSFDIGESKRDIYEYAVLVTDLDDELLTIAAHYRDRADAENTKEFVS